MQDAVSLQCPWCFEQITLWIAMDDLGEMVVDCEVCCRPWQVVVRRDETGRLQATATRP